MADYPISNVARRVVYANTGVGPYAFTFEILANTDIAVYRGSTLLTLTTDYSVTINANGTGSVTLVTAGTGNITIVGARAIQRTSDYTTGGDLFASTLNTDLDSLTIYTQQVAETAERGLKAPVVDPTDINMTLPAKATRAGTVLAFDSPSGNPVAGPTIAAVGTVSGNIANINTVAGISANVTTVAGISSNVTTVAGISGNVTTVANNNANITTVADDLNEPVSEINTVAVNITNVNTVGNNISSVNTVAGEIGAGQDVTVVAADLSGSNTIGTVATNIANVNATGSNIANVNAVGADLLEPVSEINTVATDITNVNTVGTNIANVNTVAGISANVTSVAGNATNINAVAGNSTNINAVAGNATNINAVNSNASNINTVAGINANVTTVAGISSNVTTVATNNANVTTVATNIASVNTCASDIAQIITTANDLNEAVSEIETVANNIANVNTVGTNIANVNTVAGISANVTTVATNVADVTNYADTYLGPKTSDPTLRNDSSALQAGDLYFNTTDDVMKVYSGSAWLAAYASLSGALIAANNLSDLASVSAARTNLGLGSSDSPTFAGLTDSGNLTFTGTGNRITGDFSNGTLANRVAFQTSTTNGNTALIGIPNGTATTSAFALFGGNDPANAQFTQLLCVGGSDSRIVSSYNGTPTSGTYLPLTMYTGGSERLRIDTSGNVGIGTSSPAVKLDIASATGITRVTSTTGTNAVYSYLVNTGGGFYIGRENSAGSSFGSSAYASVLYSEGNYPMAFFTNGSEKMRVTSDGNVGIGVSPSGTSKLDVNGQIYSSNGTASAPAFTSRGQNNAGLFFTDDGVASVVGVSAGGAERMRIVGQNGNVGIGTNSPSAKLEINKGSAGSLVTFTDGVNTNFNFSTSSLVGTFGTDAGSTALALKSSGVERMRITSGGSVGIGTTVPSGKLTVDDGTSKYVNLVNSGSTIALQAYGIFTTAHVRMTYPSVADWDMLAGSSGQLAFLSNSAERMRIDSSGNVGIGVTSPAQKLDVYGSARLTYSGGNNYVEFESANNYVGRNSSGNMILNAASGNNVLQSVGGTTITQATGAGLFQFNSGYGSVATAYGCRAWVNFDGTGTPAIRASGNVSSITDNGTGDYTVNFTNAMPDINYSATGFAWASNKNACAIFLGPKVTTSNPETTSSIRVATRDNISETVMYDPEVVNVAVFR